MLVAAFIFILLSFSSSNTPLTGGTERIELINSLIVNFFFFFTAKERQKKCYIIIICIFVIHFQAFLDAVEFEFSSLFFLGATLFFYVHDSLENIFLFEVITSSLSQH